MTRAEACEAVYGFGYEPAAHDGLLRVLVHRCRELAPIHAEGGRLEMSIDRPIAIADPRCSLPIEASVLSILGRRASVGTREIAAELRLPVRTIQEALQRLGEEGAIVEQRDGRHIEYAVEDTTFSEATARLRLSRAPSAR